MWPQRAHIARSQGQVSAPGVRRVPASPPCGWRRDQCGLMTAGMCGMYRWVPVFADKEQRLSVMSIGFLLDSPDAPVVWRGPKKNGNTLLKSFAATSQCLMFTLRLYSCNQAVPRGCVLGRSGLPRNRHASGYVHTHCVERRVVVSHLRVLLLAGTSDEHISVTQYLGAFNPDGAVIVTTPQVRPRP